MKKKPKEPPTLDKVMLVNKVLSTIEEPWLFLCLLEGKLMNVSVSQVMPQSVFHRMLAQLIVTTAEVNDIKPIKMLSDLGDEICKLMDKQEERKRDRH